MLRAGASVAMVAAMVLCATLGLLAAEAPDLKDRLPEGTKAIMIKLPEDRQLPADVDAGMAVDVVGEISEPLKTSIAILNVTLLARDSLPIGAREDRNVTVHLTPAQYKALKLMEKHGTKLSIRLNQ